MKTLYLTLGLACALACATHRLEAQQLPDRSLFLETAFLWNPAMTGLGPYWELSAVYRQQWLGFDNAPRTASAAIQYPVPKSNSALGGYFMSDHINPLVVNHFAFQYAYKLRFGDAKNQQLSVGISATVQHFLWDAVNMIVNDPDDPLAPAGDFNTLGPNAGAGLFYTTNARQDDKRSTLYIGASVQQAAPVNVVFENNNSSVNLRHALHAHAIAGGRFVSGNVLWEPAFWLHYAAPGIANGYFHLRMESRDALWAGLCYSTNQTVGVQAGVVVKKGFTKDGQMRIGAAGSFNMGTFGQFRGPGYEFMATYRFAQ